MIYISVDIEADGPIPGDYSMVSLGAIVVNRELNQTFYSEIAPISEKWIPDALAISGFSRKQTLQFPKAETVMSSFSDWVNKKAPPGEQARFVSDNGFDWMFVCWYLWHFAGNNPFGFSSLNLKNLYHGLSGNMRSNLSKLRGTKHTHNALDDATGNAEAMLKIIDKHKLNIKFPKAIKEIGFNTSK